MFTEIFRFSSIPSVKNSYFKADCGWKVWRRCWVARRVHIYTFIFNETPLKSSYFQACHHRKVHVCMQIVSEKLGDDELRPVESRKVGEKKQVVKKGFLHNTGGKLYENGEWHAKDWMQTCIFLSSFFLSRFLCFFLSFFLFVSFSFSLSLSLPLSLSLSLSVSLSL